MYMLLPSFAINICIIGYITRRLLSDEIQRWIMQGLGCLSCTSASCTPANPDLVVQLHTNQVQNLLDIHVS